MLEQLLNLVKGEAQETVINNTAIPNEYNNDVVAEATNTVASGLRNMVAGGGLQNLLSLFSSGENMQQGAVNNLMNNPLVNMMVGHFSGKLMSKFNMNGNDASNVASNLIPSVLNNLVNKTNDPSNNGFSLDGLLNSITGGKVAEQQVNGGFDLQSLIGQFTGGGNNGGTGTGELMDIVSQFTQGAQAQQQKNAGAGLMDLIQGFLKK
jgi:hypothetical protein